MDVAARISLAALAALLAFVAPWLLVLLAAPLIALHRTGRRADASRHQALHDVLTGLPNRALFGDRVERALAGAERAGTRPVVMLLDLDGFKEVNDALGHHNGDRLLQLIGPRIEGVLRSSDTVARLGGDEFAVLLPTAPHAAAGAEVGDKILAALAEPFHIEGVELEVRASLGLACWPLHGEDGETLVRRADAAMYEAKGRASGARVSVVEPESLPDTLAIAGELRSGLDDGELAVVYQPKVDLLSGATHGVEALVRWEHPSRGLVLPGGFVGHAEHTGLIRPLTMHVLEEALEQADAWRRGGLDLRVAVNVSARNLLDRGLPAAVAGLLDRWDVPAGALELELTESTIMADPTAAREVLEALHDLGVGLSIDDFGTGYSSLSKLRELPFDEIKMDRSFVTGMARDRDAETIVRSTIDLARNLGLRVVAEGVESDEVRERLVALGCDLGQGYLFSVPLDGDALASWMGGASVAAAA